MHLFSNPWKHQKILRFSDVFRGQRKGALGTKGLMNFWLLTDQTDIEIFLKKLFFQFFLYKHRVKEVLDKVF